jgi:hypothetical protein
MSASTITTGRAAQAAAHGQEALMGQVVPSQHPAVVLRSHFNQLRALLAVALIAVIGLTVAVAILADDEDQLSDTSSAAPIGRINYGGYNPATGRPESAPLPQPEHPLRSRLGTARYDGGPEEGTRGVLPPSSSTAAADGSAYTQLRSAGALRYDGGPEEGTRGPRSRTD